MRGILLSSVPGKIFGRIVNGRLHEYFERHNVFPDTQCGFRAGRGTTDMIFTLRMAMELARLKSHPLWFLFVDLAKAYDSVSREGLWALLLHKGVPLHLVNLIRQYYSGKVARISVEGILSKEIPLHTGLGQGCCMAPTLFNVFLAAVMEHWTASVSNVLKWPYRLDGVLRRHMDPGTLRKYSTWETLMLHDLGYADDAAFIADTYEQLASWARALQAHYSTWGLSLSVAKTEALTTAAEGGRGPISMDAPEGAPSQIQFSSCFQYLGTQISQDGSCVSDISRRLDLARKAFWQLTANVWDVAQLALSTKLRVYRACVLSVLLYGAETWTTTFTCRRKLEKFHMQCLRKIAHVSLWDQERWSLPNAQLRQCLGVPSVMDLVSQARLRWLGHVARMDSSRLPKRMMFAFLPASVGVARPVGRRPGSGYRKHMSRT